MNPLRLTFLSALMVMALAPVAMADAVVPGDKDYRLTKEIRAIEAQKRADVLRGMADLT